MPWNARCARPSTTSSVWPRSGIVPIEDALPEAFAARLLAWYDRHGRHDLPWQHPRDPYRIWVAEIMLQQTRVETVIPYFERFLARFPDVQALAAASEDEVLGLWSGLGYYARARNLHRAARRIQEVHGGEMPRALEPLMALPGIGRSTAGAILAQAFDARHPILDGNVKRVLARHRAIDGWPGEAQVARRLWSLAEALTPRQRVADYTQAIMDLGATLCTRSRPGCTACPVQEDCRARASGDPLRWPQPRPRRVLPVRKTCFVLLRRGEEVLLERRPSPGLWGGLWCFPQQPDPAAARAWLAAHLGLVGGRMLPPFRHSFTHFRLEITPLLCEVPENRRSRTMEGRDRVWYNVRSSPAMRGVPAPVRRLLDSLETLPGESMVPEDRR
ncbi:MAG: adenine DNA glycosylase [Gammaproteobacteria bacterium]|nr:MAG: adenine DNA glycosylase [Gammaproteobacteria bacterium]